MIDKRSILIADDEVNLCRILDAELKKAGYSVTAVHDGAQAVEQVRLGEFQVIILDVRMPVLDGLSALREIRKVQKNTPVIMMTAYESHDTMASALSMGATACVNKPFDLDSLVALVRATINDGNGRSSLNWSASVRTVLFNRNQPVLMEIQDGEHAGRHQARIEDKDDQTLTVLCYSDEGTYIVPRVGGSISIGFAGEDAFYSFDTNVLANRESYPPTFLVGKPAVIYRVQRRKYPRMVARIPIDLALIEKDDNGGSTGPSVLTYTDNIGPGGLRTLMDGRLPAGAEVGIDSRGIPGLDAFSGRGKVTRVREIVVEDTIRWEHGIQFTKLPDETRRILQGIAEHGELS